MISLTESAHTQATLGFYCYDTNDIGNMFGLTPL